MDHIAPENFDYSKALNVGIEEARGELVAILSAHAIPLDDGWLERMIAPFEDPTVAGVGSREIAWRGRRGRRSSAFAQRSRHPARVPERRHGRAAIQQRRLGDQPQHLGRAPIHACGRRGPRLGAAGHRRGHDRGLRAGGHRYHSHDKRPRAQTLRKIDINRALTPAGGRTRWRTLREAAALLYNGGRAIHGLDEPVCRKLAYLGELQEMAWYYLIDFSQAGTTAERRGERATPRSQ